MQPRVDLKAPKPPERAEPSDQDREARSPERAEGADQPAAVLARQHPRAGRADGPRRPRAARARRRIRRPASRRRPSPTRRRRRHRSAAAPGSHRRCQLPSSRTGAAAGANGQRPPAGGSLGDALRNLQRYVQRDQFDNPQGGGAFGPAIQFDTKGVEFGPWIRRFIAQVKRNWLIPYAAMSMKGHVVVTFNVHKDGIDHRSAGRRPVVGRRVQQRRVRRAGVVESDAAAAARVSVRQGVLHRHVLLQRRTAVTPLAAARPGPAARRPFSSTCLLRL